MFLAVINKKPFYIIKNGSEEMKMTDSSKKSKKYYGETITTLGKASISVRRKSQKFIQGLTIHIRGMHLYALATGMYV